MRDLIKKLINTYNLPAADRYDLFYREFDDKVEVLGLMRDPTMEFNDFENREMLFPKRWVTIGVIDAQDRIKI